METMERKNLTREAYEKIKAQIINMHIHLGTYLSETKLASTLKIGRTPIREAIQKLKHEGFIKVIPCKGIFVNSLSATEIQQIYEMAEGLEGMAAKLAAERASEEEIDVLQRVVNKMKLALVEENKEAWMAADSEFHEIVLQMARNKYIAEAMTLINGLIHRVRKIYLQTIERPVESTNEHAELARMIAAHNSDLAKKITEKHLRRIRKHNVRIFQGMKAI